MLDALKAKLATGFSFTLRMLHTVKLYWQSISNPLLPLAIHAGVSENGQTLRFCKFL